MIMRNNKSQPRITKTKKITTMMTRNYMKILMLNIANMTVMWRISHCHQAVMVVVTGKELLGRRQMMMKRRKKNLPGKESTI